MSDKFHGNVKAGSTSVSTPIYLAKTADNTALTALVAANLTAAYWRQGGTPTAVTLSDLAAITTAYTSGGVKEADSAKMPGTYRLDWPDAAFATGADWVILAVLNGTTGYYVERISLESKGSSEIAGVLPATGTAVDTAGGLPTIGTGAGQINPDGSGNVPASNASAIATAVWANATRTLTGFSFSVTVNGNVTVGGYAANQDPATLLLSTPAQKIQTTANGVIIDQTQTVSVRNQDAITAPTIADAYQGAWTEAFGKENESGTSYVKELPNGTNPARTFTLTLDGNGNPTARN